MIGANETHIFSIGFLFGKEFWAKELSGSFLTAVKSDDLVLYSEEGKEKKDSMHMLSAIDGMPLWDFETPTKNTATPNLWLMEVYDEGANDIIRVDAFSIFNENSLVRIHGENGTLEHYYQEKDT